MRQIILTISIVLFLYGCTSSEKQRQNLVGRFQQAYPEAWQQKLLEYDLLCQLNRPRHQPYQYNWRQQQLKNQLNQMQSDHFQHEVDHRRQRRRQRQQSNDLRQHRRQSNDLTQHNRQVLQNWKRSMNQIQQERQRQADLLMP